MTTAANDRRNDIVATAAQTAFSYTFEVADEADLVVAQNGTVLTLTTHYTVSGVGDENGGTVTLVTGATEDDAIAIYSNEDIERLADYTTAGDFKATTINAELDKIFRLLGDINIATERVLRLSDTDTQDASTFVLPNKADRLGKLLQWNATTGLPESVAAADVDITTVAGIIATFLAANTVLEAQRALDLEPGVDIQAYDADILKADTADTLTAQMSMTLQTDASSSGVVTCDFAGGDCSILLSENITDINFTNLPNMGWAMLRIKQAASGGPYTVTGYDANVDFSAQTEPVISTTASAVDLFALYYDGTDVYMVAISQDQR